MYPVGLEVFILARVFIYIHTLCMLAGKALASLDICAWLPECLLLADEISTKISYSKTCLKQPLKKKTTNWFSKQIVSQCRSKYCRMLPLEHSAILLIFIKLPFVIKIFVLSIFEWPFKKFVLYIPNPCVLRLK